MTSINIIIMISIINNCSFPRNKIASPFFYQIPVDTKVLRLGKHKLAIALYVPTFVAVLTVFGTGLFKALNVLVRAAITGYTQKYLVKAV